MRTNSKGMENARIRIKKRPMIKKKSIILASIIPSKHPQIIELVAAGSSKTKAYLKAIAKREQQQHQKTKDQHLQKTIRRRKIQIERGAR